MSRPTAAARGYDARWRRTQRRYLRSHLICERGGCDAAATEVHHLDGLGPLGPRGHDPENLQALCKPHHSAVTATERADAFGKRPPRRRPPERHPGAIG